MKNKLILLFVILFIIIPTCVLAKCTDSKGNEITTCNYEEAKDIVKELMRDYYIRGPYLQYNGSRVSYGTMSPEDATSQNINYKVCAAYADDVYKFSFGIESIDNRSSSGYYTSFPRHSYNVVDVARCLYSKVPGASVSLEGHYSSDDTTLEKAKCDVFGADYKNFLIYYASKSSDGTGNKYVDGYSSNLDKIEIQNFVDKLQPGDVIAYTGHVMVIYDIGTNPITGKKDALVLNSTQQPWIRTRIYGTSQISYNQFKSKYYYYNEYGTETPIATNGILDVEEEGTIQFFWLGTS